MTLERIGILALPLALASCREDLDLDPNQPEIDVSAAFSAAPVSGTAPLVVQFTDESEGDVGGWDWSFGDGEIVPGTGPVSSLAHTYENPGTYTVTLHVISCTSPANCKHSWETKTELIMVTAASVASTSQTPPSVPSESAPSDSLLAGPDPAEEAAALTGKTTPAVEDRIAGALPSPSHSPFAGRAILELVTKYTLGGSAHACSIEGMDVSLLIDARTYSMSPAPSLLGTTTREEGPDACSARYVLAMPRDAWPPAAACLVVRVAAGRELPDLRQREGESDHAMVPADVAFELIAHFDGITLTVLRGTLGALGRAPRRP